MLVDINKTPQNVHVVFSTQTMKLCTRFLCAIAKTSPSLLFFCLSFRQ